MKKDREPFKKKQPESAGGGETRSENGKRTSGGAAGFLSKGGKNSGHSFFGKHVPSGQFLNFSLRKQLLFPFVTVIVIFGLSGAVFSYFYGLTTTTNDLAQSTMTQLKTVNANFSTIFNDAQAVTGQAALSDRLADPKANADAINQDFQNVISSNKLYQALTFASADKTVIRAPLYFYDKNYDPTKDSWYRLGAQGKGRFVWTNPYADNVTQQSIVSVAEAVMDHGKVKGVVKLDFFLQTIVNQIRGTKFGNSGYAALLDKSGTYISAPKNNEIGANVRKQSFYQKMNTMGRSGMFYATIDGRQKLICFEKNQTTGWTLLGVIDKSEISNKANLIALPSALIVLIILIVAIWLTDYLLKKMIARIRKIEETAKRIENGDLTVSIPVKGSDELAELTGSINQMARVNREAFEKMNEVSRRIMGASQTLVASVEENTAATNEISATVNEIARGASDQSKSIEGNLSSLQSLVDAVRKMDARSKEVLLGANQMAASSKEGEEKLKHLSVQSKASSDTTGQIIQAVSQLEKQIAGINEIVDVLGGIARRTNLLSLNASIEAAHAGEHGKGFAVVAGEIRQLARQTNQSLKHVTEMVKEMNEQTNHAVELCEETGRMVQMQSAAVEETNRAFREIDRTIETNVKGIQAIAGAIRKTEANIEQISEGSQMIASTSEETAAGTEEVSASVEEENAAMEELNKLAGDLDQQAGLMRKAIGQFKI
ncbi:methyl-accepting chemotaxis protein [Sporolactobacillus sp. KGMB 08714]|uniref:methyl-accepting chemotaxis protein n=1 Tax=Sporolactobacillus sp. KGMB 08714 TaxID=3064704 RepID=UPI002FBEA5FF